MGLMTEQFAPAFANEGVAHPRQIAGEGTPDAAWQAWHGLRQLPPVAAHELVTPGQRAIIVAPHPDDEVLACGGLLQLLAAQGTRTVVVAATDGDASHPGSAMYPPAPIAIPANATRYRFGMVGSPA